MTNIINAASDKADSILTPFLYALDSLNRLPGIALAVLACLVVGFALKRSKTFPNSWIPMAVMLVSMLIAFLLAPPKPEDVAITFWRAKNCVVGMVAGGIAWFIHAQIFKKLVAMFPFLSGWLPTDDDGTPPPQP